MILSKSKNAGIDLSNIIREKLKTSSIKELLLIVPTNRKLRNIKKELIAGSFNQTANVINLETIGTLSGKILSHYKSYIPLTEAAGSVLLKQSVVETKLQYFSGYRDGIPTGTLDRIKSVISEYKRAGVKPVDLLKESENLKGSEKNKAVDIAGIYNIYNKKCSELGVKETGDIYSEVNILNAEQFQKIFLELYPSVNIILLDGFNEFTEPEIVLIDKLSCVKKELYLNFNYYDKNNLIFAHLDKSYNSLLRMGFSPIVDLSTEQQSEFRSHIRHNLFRITEQKLGTFKEKLKMFSGLTREKEVEYIAKQIKFLITEDKVQPHLICVAFNLIDKYSPIVRDVFTNTGIPFNLTDRISLSKSSAVTVILNYLEIIENDFYYKNLFRALTNEQLRIKNIDLAGLIKVAVEKKIISGYNNWKTSIQEAIEELNSNSDKDNISKEKELQIYNKALEDIETLSEFLHPFTKKLTLTEFYSNLKILINQLDLPVKLLGVSNKEEESIKSVTEFLETVAEILKLFEMEYSPEERFSLTFYLDQIRTAIISARFNVKEKSNYGVLITTINEIRGLNFEYLFLSGMTDGDFPTRYSPEIFVSGTYTRNELIHQTEERYNFYQVLCTWEKELCLTYPLQDKEKELTPSNFIKDFTELFEVTEIKSEEFDKKIYSKNELLKIAGMSSSLIPDSEKEVIDLNNLNKAIIIDRSRKNDPFAKNIYSGSVIQEGEEAAFKLSQQAVDKLNLFGEREFSISQLEKYASCPYQYFLEKILYLNVIEEPSEEFEAFEKGTLLHSILYEFYIVIRNKKIIIAGSNDLQFNLALDLLFSIAEKQVSEASFNSVLSFYDKEAILGINGDRKNSILYQFLVTERNSSPDFVPFLFEQNFNEIINIDSKPVKIRGKIDRVEINTEEKTFHTVDYKLGGKKPSQDDLLNGISLQLPLYMYAASKLLKASLSEDYSPADALIYSLKYKEGNFGRQSINLKSNQSFEKLSDDKKQAQIEANKELIRICIEMIVKFTELIKNGTFHLSKLNDRENKVCRFCNFHTICRIRETE